jgi:Holliday junction resolvasome RuvABC endonuclease subunit
MGLDLALTCTGVVMMGPKNYKTWPVKTDSKKPLFDRILTVRDFIAGKISKFGEPTLVTIENYAFGKFGKSRSVSKNIELAASIKYYLWMVKIPFVVIAPSMNKKWLFKKGTAKKEHMLKEVYKRFQVDVDTNDEADAWSLADLGFHLVSNKPRRKLLKHEIDIIAALKKSEEKILRSL